MQQRKLYQTWGHCISDPTTVGMGGTPSTVPNLGKQKVHSGLGSQAVMPQTIPMGPGARESREGDCEEPAHQPPPAQHTRACFGLRGQGLLLSLSLGRVGTGFPRRQHRVLGSGSASSPYLLGIHMERPEPS